MDDDLLGLLKAIRFECDGLPEHLMFIVDAARAHGLDEVPQYAPLVAAMANAATMPLLTSSE